MRGVKKSGIFFVFLLLIFSSVFVNGGNIFEVSEDNNKLTGLSFIGDIFGFFQKLAVAPALGGAVKCEQGEFRDCTNQNGVCKHSKERCQPDGTFHGCDEEQYDHTCGYDIVEERCNDGRDNDCDGKADSNDNDCASKDGSTVLSNLEIEEKIKESKKKTDEYVSTIIGDNLVVDLTPQDDEMGEEPAPAPGGDPEDDETQEGCVDEEGNVDPTC